MSGGWNVLLEKGLYSDGYTALMSGDTDTATAANGRDGPLAFHWFLPTQGDGRRLIEGTRRPGVAGGPRAASLGYLTQVALAAEELGFEGALTPTGLWCEDAWVSTAMLSQRTERLKFMIAFRPGLVSPTLAAQMAATFQRHSGGRLLLNVVTGGDSDEQRALGDHLDKDARYERTAEFLSIVRELWRGEQVDLDGRAAGGGRRSARAAAGANAADLLRRLLPGRARRRRAPRRRVPQLGRAALAAARQARRRRDDRLRAGPAAAARHPAARRLSRQRRGRVARGRAAARRHPRRDDRARPRAAARAASPRGSGG